MTPSETSATRTRRNPRRKIKSAGGFLRLPGTFGRSQAMIPHFLSPASSDHLQRAPWGRSSPGPKVLAHARTRTEHASPKGAGHLALRKFGLVRSARPRQDSNLGTRFRKPMLYPLSYGGGAGAIGGRKPLRQASQNRGSGVSGRSLGPASGASVRRRRSRRFRRALVPGPAGNSRSTRRAARLDVADGDAARAS